MHKCKQILPNGTADAWVKNISDRSLTEQQTRILTKGLNFNTKDANELDYVEDLESALKSTGLSDETKEHVRQQITTNLYSRRRVKLDTDEQKALKDLQVDKGIIGYEQIRLHQ